MEVYTGYGDKGMTDLSHTKNVSKSDDRICLMGSVEELMSHIGLVRVLVDDVDVVRMLEKISETLKKIIDGVSDPYNREFKVSEDRTELLEEEIGRMKEIFSGERLPILPGDSRVAAEIDVTRAVARRAERELALVSVKFGSDTGAKKYMNRLSDYFYVLARYVYAAKIEEKKTDISESVQESVKAETAGIVANVGVELAFRNANLEDMLENISIPEFTLRKEDGSTVKASELTADGKHILAFLEEEKEPTEHILNEMMEQEEAFSRYANRIIFVVKSKKALETPTLSRALGKLGNVQILYDDFSEIINTLGRRMYVDPDKLPLIIVTNKSLNGIYATSGYNVGTGDMLLRLM